VIFQIDLEEMLREETKTITDMKNKLDTVCKSNWAIEAETFDVETKIDMTLGNAMEQHKTLTLAAGRTMDDIWSPDTGVTLNMPAYSDLLSRLSVSKRRFLPLNICFYFFKKKN
jgi:hypothetical protein